MSKNFIKLLIVSIKNRNYNNKLKIINLRNTLVFTIKPIIELFLHKHVTLYNNDKKQNVTDVNVTRHITNR